MDILLACFVVLLLFIFYAEFEIAQMENEEPIFPDTDVVYTIEQQTLMEQFDGLPENGSHPVPSASTIYQNRTY
ncbi:unnamed protein product [Caenorhabditis angaria]|uniref:Uncharacterized protein n=1 Tax=Caenorhabditis angaria TaxID=860376 RepID=A0A9P1N6R3_9PELO|nr:unnamed protein product [Caenorhabditis angaria]